MGTQGLGYQLIRFTWLAESVVPLDFVDQLNYIHSVVGIYVASGFSIVIFLLQDYRAGATASSSLLLALFAGRST